MTLGGVKRKKQKFRLKFMKRMECRGGGEGEVQPKLPTNENSGRKFPVQKTDSLKKREGGLIGMPPLRWAITSLNGRRE